VSRLRSGRLTGGARAVLERDFLVLTSAGKYVLLRTGVVVALAVLAFAMLSSLGIWDSAFGAQREEWGRTIFAAFAVAYPILVSLVGPALASGSIAGERSTDTLSLVLAAPVSPFGLVFAKFLSRLLALLVPLLGGLPIAALSFLYGGISPGLFVAWAGVVLGLAVIAVASSVLASAYARSMAAAIMLSYLLACVVPILESWAAYALAEEARHSGWPWPDFVTEHTPFGALVNVFESVGGRGTIGGEIWPFFVAAALGAAGALVLAAARLSRESQAMSGGGPRRGRAVRPISANPVLDRAMFGLPFRRGGIGVWVTFGVVALLTWLPVTAGDWEDEEILVGLNFGTWVVAFAVLARASQCLAVERQQGSLAVLRTTALSENDIVDGKLLGLAAHAGVLLLPPASLAALGCVIGDSGPAISFGCAAAWLVTTGVVLLIFASVGMRASARAGTSGRAAGLAFGVTLGAMVAHGLLSLVVALAAGANDTIMMAVLTASPPWFLAMLTDAANSSRGGNTEVQMVAWAVFWAVAWTLTGIALLRATTRAIEQEGD
jgi:ABC-type transport system involved in multi-copper enzyme maturation permease subunit